ncbi:unnamed protein product [Acanthoscelides obtectus]|uniref:PX domain-containing protein n=1 Tax=Acanthoscelides obtectus TaxID=200917 RepID=A0A9P0NV92_ACAOB|nr:unnamed protein product [Acanthoscelides obtectus]CAK1621276.1 Sorting nexin-21 [Acanthoscelides obtectus]
MTQIMAEKKQGLTFEIVSARISDVFDEKKHVVYALQVRFISGNDDMSPSVVERRYTHFLNLYNALKKEHPQLMSTVVFPKKVLIGNFDNDLISTRSTGFESLLNHISTESRLRTSKSLLDFLQDTELSKAKEFIKKEDYITACPILENNFKLLNKVDAVGKYRSSICCCFIPRKTSSILCVIFLGFLPRNVKPSGLLLTNISM